MCVLTHWGPKLFKITQVYLSDHLINIEVEKYGSSAFKHTLRQRHNSKTWSCRPERSSPVSMKAWGILQTS